MSSLVRPLVSSLKRSLKGVALDELKALIRTLFSAGEEGAIYIPKPIVLGAQALFQNSAGTVPVTADGDPVGRVLDQSGNGNHATQSVSAERMGYSEPNGLLQDQVDDGIAINGLPLHPAVGTKTWTLCVSYSVLGTEDIILLSNQGENNPWIGVATDGATSTKLNPDGVVQVSVYFDGVLSTPSNRGAMWAGMASSSVIVIEFTVDNSISWANPLFGKYFPDPFSGPKTSEFYLLREGALTESERKDVEAYAAEQAGTTL